MMKVWKRRAIGYSIFVGVALLLTAVGYQWGMRTFEGRPRTFLDSLRFAVEMFTTTGFGGDARWKSPEMQAFIAVVNLLGMASLVGALPVFVAPLLESTLSPTAPQELENSLSNHIVLCSDTTREDELIAELDANDVPYVIVESDRDRADQLSEREGHVINADPQSTEGLRAAGLESARALFADVSDQVDASIVLTAKEVAEEVPVVSVVEDPDTETYHRLAGADHVLSPRPLIGEALASKITTVKRAEIDENVTVGEQFQLAEVSVQHGSRLAGTTLANSGVRERSGVNVIGVWLRGEFHPAPSPDRRLEGGSVLLVSGRSDQLQQLSNMIQSTIRQFQAGHTIVVGYGQVGKAVAAEFDDAGVSYTVIDQHDLSGVDVVGDATDPDVLTEAGIEDAKAVVLALPDDTTTEFATLVVRDRSPETQILARVQQKANASKTYRAGADYVLSLATVTGRMSASRLLEDHDVVSIDQQIKIKREQVSGLAGDTLSDSDIRSKTGCTVIALVRDGEVITDIGPDTRIGPADDLIIVGTNQRVRTFEQEFR
jgi:Trk K+ transport system NAD-binding subunit